MKTFKHLSMLLALMMCSFAFTACSDDDDDNKDNTLADYYVEFALVDKGTLTSAEASTLIGSLNSEDLTLDGYTYSEATYAFNKFTKELAEDLNEEHDYSVTFKANLKTDNKTVSSKTFYITKTGCTLK